MMVEALRNIVDTFVNVLIQHVVTAFYFAFNSTYVVIQFFFCLRDAISSRNVNIFVSFILWICYDMMSFRCFRRITGLLRSNKLLVVTYATISCLLSPKSFLNFAACSLFISLCDSLVLFICSLSCQAASVFPSLLIR